MIRSATILLTATLAVTMLSGSARAAESSAQSGDPLARKITGADAYVPFFGIRAAVTSGFGVAGLVAVDVGLEIPDPDLRRRAISGRARLVDAMREAVADYAHRSHIAGEVPDARLLKSRLQRAVDRRFGRGNASVTLASLILFED